MRPPKLDRRSQDHVYQRALALARATMPDWSYGFGPGPDYFSRADVGLALFKLFAELHGKLAGPLNGVPDKYALAFWDFLGVGLRPPTAAEAPLVFVPATDRAARIPAETIVIATGVPNIQFETAADLVLLPVSVAAGHAVRPAADSVVDYSTRIGGQGEPFPLFAHDPAEQPIVHALHMADPQFDFTGLTGSLTITLEGVNLYRRFFESWSDAQGVAVLPQFEVVAYDTLTITFADLPALPAGSVGGQAGNWLSVMPQQNVRIFGFQQEILPQIYSVLATINLTAIAPDASYFNNAAVDLKKGGQPFGATPAVQDAFYLASKGCFSKTGAAITLDFTLTPVTPPGTVTLAWEYWSGKAWTAISDLLDGTANLTRPGKVTFTCPQIFSTSVNNKANYWIRVRIAAGGYGSPASARTTIPAEKVVDGALAPYITERLAAIAALKQQGITFGIQYQPASFTPPFIRTLTIDCMSMKQPDTLMAQNGAVYAPMARTPYIPCDEQEATFYLGLSIANFAAVAEQSLTLFFAPVGAADPGLLPQTREGMRASIAAGAPSAALRLSYLANGGWKPLYAVNVKNDARAEGIISVRLPLDFAPASLFGQELYWLRVLPPEDIDYQVPDMVGIFANAVAAFNAVTHRDVILGSSTGAPVQTFAFPNVPVLNGAVVDVLEPRTLTPLYASAAEPAQDQAQSQAANPAPSGDLALGWRTWTEVSNFDFSGPASRHFILDHTTGVLAFGDGVHGMVPPQGVDNIRATYFQAGGGIIGNVDAGALDALHRLDPAVRSVGNVLPAAGGVAADEIAELKVRAPDQVKSQDRAVTCADFSALAIAASQQVARATCASDATGRILVSILPNAPGQTPLPNFDLLDRVAGYLRQRCLPQVRDLVLIRGPDYVDLNATAEIVPAASASRSTLSAAAAAAFQAYLNPLTGGAGRQGWSFGSRAHASDLARALGGIDQVNTVGRVTFDQGASSIGYSANQLPQPGTLTIEFVNADAI